MGIIQYTSLTIPILNPALLQTQMKETLINQQILLTLGAEIPIFVLFENFLGLFSLLNFLRTF